LPVYFPNSIIFSSIANPFFNVNLPSITTVTSIPATLTVTATTQSASVQYQWYKNAAIVQAYSSSNTLSISSPVNGDNYYCVAKDANANTTNSSTTTLAVSLPNPIVITPAPITTTVVQNTSWFNNKPFKPFTVSGVSSYTVVYNSDSTSPNAPPIYGTSSGVVTIIDSPSTIGNFTYSFTITSGSNTVNTAFTINVVSQSQYNLYTTTQFNFSQAYPPDATNQAGLWTATLDALKNKNNSVTIYNLLQNNGSVLNTVASSGVLDTTGLTVTYNGVTYTQSNAIVITPALINITVVQGSNSFTNKPFQPFTVSGVSSYSVTYNSSTPANAPPISITSGGIATITGAGNTTGLYTYSCTVTSGSQSSLATFTINVVSQSTFNSYPSGQFTFSQQYPESADKQAGLWNATLNAIYVKNPSATVYSLSQSSGSVINNTASNVPLDTTGLTVTYDGITYTQPNVPCVLGFSQIRMSDGSVKAIRDIQPGDDVVSALTHKSVKVKEIRSRKVDYKSLNEENHIRVIPKGFFGEDSPSRDLYISGLHCVMLKIADTVNCPRNRLSFQARRLSSTFKLPTPEEIKALTGEEDVVYYHIDLDGFDAVYCEDVPIESYYREN